MSTEEEIMACIAKGYSTIPEIKQETGINIGTIYTCMRKLIRKGKVERFIKDRGAIHGQYRIIGT